MLPTTLERTGDFNMTEQTLETEQYPCIFGGHISSNCPVRVELNKGRKGDLSKYITSPGILGEAKDLIGTFSEVLNHANNTLANFCRSCPYIKR